MKKLLILTLAVLSFVACDQAAKPAPVRKHARPTKHAAAKPAEKVVEKKVSDDYILPGLNGDSYNFSEKINEKPVVIAFMAGFCGWCKKMLPYMDELAVNVDPTKVDVIIGFMDPTSKSLVDLEPVKNAKYINIYYNAGKLMQQNEVQGFPTIMLFKDGKQLETWHGYSPNHVDSILQSLKDIGALE